MTRRTHKSPPPQEDLALATAVAEATASAAAHGHQIVPCPVSADTAALINRRCRLCGTFAFIERKSLRRYGGAFEKDCPIPAVLALDREAPPLGPGWSGRWDRETGDVHLLIFNPRGWRTTDWHVVGGPHPNGIYIKGRFYELLLGGKGFAFSDRVSELARIAEEWEDAIAYEMAKPRIVLPPRPPIVEGPGGQFALVLETVDHLQRRER